MNTLKYQILKNNNVRITHPDTGRPITLYRIYALRTFNTIVGEVKEGSTGGFVESEVNLMQDDSSWIYHNGKVFDSAVIFDSVVQDDAKLFENCVVKESYIGGKARIYGNSKVLYSEVYNNVDIYDECIIENSQLHNSVEVGGHARVTESQLYDGCKVNQRAKVNKSKLKFGIQCTGLADLYNCQFTGTFTISTKRLNETVTNYPDLKIESGNASGTGNELDAF